jgi:hypothetical protein
MPISAMSTDPDVENDFEDDFEDEEMADEDFD